MFYGKNKGFTLTELLVVIAITGIPTAIALPSNQAHIQNANHMTAQLSLTEMALKFKPANGRDAEPCGLLSIAAVNEPTLNIINCG